ncbi:MAG: AarF/ABC1/UbiB kinase family protein [Candidatus Schekmanbacteria bacterium]|nr:AarF/ABC1/UbiB kinase family protein [Candidatus Schekmanbacteria bacterium]
MGEQKSIATSRIARLASVGNLAFGFTTSLTKAAGRTVVGQDRAKTAESFHRDAAQTLLSTLAGMKGLPMKVGQLLSYVDDFVPETYRRIYGETLAALQVKAHPMRWNEIRGVMERDLGRNPESAFLDFDRAPIAAASIGQVYRATLRDGRKVAVKVQYPGIKDAIESDLKNLDLLRHALGLILPKVDVERSLADIVDRLREECDYGCELCNQIEFAKIWRNDSQVLVPAMIEELCGEHVLVSELVSGDSFAEMLAGADQQRKSAYGMVLFKFLFASLYCHGMFNADPHPGNYLFLPDGRVAFLDFGCVQRYGPDLVRSFHAARSGVLQGRRDGEFRALLRNAYGIPEDVDDEEWDFLIDYIACCMDPIREDRLFRYDREYTEKLADVGMKGAMMGARKAMRKGIREAKAPGMVFLNRIQYGFASVLAAMQAEANWYRLMAEIDALYLGAPS